MRELCWRLTKFIANGGTSKLHQLCKVPQKNPCDFPQELYDQQVKFHNKDASSAENTEQNDKKQQQKYPPHRPLPLLTVNGNGILFWKL